MAEGKPKRDIPKPLAKVLSWDKAVTKSAFDWFDRTFGLNKHRVNLKFLEYSCHGHATRAAAVTWFFTSLYPLHIVLRLPVIGWGVAVMASRVFLGRHHILDVVAGFGIGFLEYVFMTLIWMDRETAEGWASYFGAEDPWSSA